MERDGSNRQNLRAVAALLEKKGRNGDTVLAHITPEEALHLKDHGGAGTRNPETGLIEFHPGAPKGADTGPSTSDGLGGSKNPRFDGPDKRADKNKDGGGNSDWGSNPIGTTTPGLVDRVNQHRTDVAAKKATEKAAKDAAEAQVDAERQQRTKAKALQDQQDENDAEAKALNDMRQSRMDEAKKIQDKAIKDQKDDKALVNRENATYGTVPSAPTKNLDTPDDTIAPTVDALKNTLQQQTINKQIGTVQRNITNIDKQKDDLAKEINALESDLSNANTISKATGILGSIVGIAPHPTAFRAGAALEAISIGSSITADKIRGKIKSKQTEIENLNSKRDSLNGKLQGLNSDHAAAQR